ncbi:MULTISPECIES: iron chelate uptake ABC transporter family permease subunit [Bacillaceae]|jgi:iron complex transport system permease protein|uniref:Iron chelate uptake ABC transporter family permease subunit n=2 Tax=Bacillaceae TaxID=186817 RepID=A0ABU9JV51_9BACI|nr:MULTISPECIES: iron chelate uptake ABC transporter family permease subunit [Bacillaceae]MCM3053839.1 iron chelate uptake ABC transporter family permease subunit [Caldibacillus thermoamylovorans]MCM3475978.1 iron chelate uptake ABC transporter family permease subunit [Caldibacillus thermoamylovorans]MED4852999.1 iron chelate uptake ABC transporter family permease subunit [Caldifermentibacillus hisashii]PAC37239.1 iron ABC transporter permease [Caldifermentibacillus hisashii]CEE00973.1 putativ
MNYKTKTWLLAALSVIFICLFLFTDITGNWEYILERRTYKVAAIILTGVSIALATVVFQTITQNRILTPSILGLDSLYMLINTFIIFVFGSTTLTSTDKNIQFIVIVAIMILFSGLLYKLLFKRNEQNIYFLLLIGFIIGTFFDSFSSFMQVLIDPNEFQIVQDRMFASFNNINTDVLLLATVLIILTLLLFLRFFKYLDVLALGRDHAINLGVDFDYVVKRLLVIVAILISISTALVGPITFLGLLVSNLAYEFLKTYRHFYLLLGASLISVVALVGGQLVVERIFTFSTTLSVIINFIGGVYFIYLLLKENRSW